MECHCLWCSEKGKMLLAMWRQQTTNIRNQRHNNNTHCRVQKLCFCREQSVRVICVWCRLLNSIYIFTLSRAITAAGATARLNCLHHCLCCHTTLSQCTLLPYWKCNNNITSVLCPLIQTTMSSEDHKKAKTCKQEGCRNVSTERRTKKRRLQKGKRSILCMYT